MWSVWCRVCLLHNPTFTPTYWRTPLFSNHQALKERQRSGNHRRPYPQRLRFKEVKRKTGLFDLWNVFHKEEKAILGTHNQIPYAQNYLFKHVTFYVHIFTLHRLIRYSLCCRIFIPFLLENDDMESTKRSAIFIIRCLTKCNLIWTLEASILKGF